MSNTLLSDRNFEEKENKIKLLVVIIPLSFVLLSIPQIRERKQLK